MLILKFDCIRYFWSLLAFLAVELLIGHGFKCSLSVPVIFKPFVLSLAPPCGLPTDKFRGFVEQHPEFAEDFLYTENTGLHSAPCHHHQTSPSSPSLQATATTKTANGICPDFSPNDHSMRDGLLKKHNWKSFKILDVENRLLSWWEGVLFLFVKR